MIDEEKLKKIVIILFIVIVILILLIASLIIFKIRAGAESGVGMTKQEWKGLLLAGSGLPTNLTYNFDDSAGSEGFEAK